jgi:hypothetical protein
LAVGSFFLALFLLGALDGAPESRAQERPRVRRITWADVAPLASRLEAHGITAGAFASYVQSVHDANARRVREGDLDHLVFYLLQSTRITPRPPIEPALSAKGLVDGLVAGERETFLRTAEAPSSRVAQPVRDRIRALMRALDSSTRDPRLEYFRGLVRVALPREREAALLREYLRVMRFVYEKEFVAQRSSEPAAAVAQLYRERGLSTDTAVEAGYLVYLGLGVAKSLGSGRVRRALIIGPGLDLAPRTAFREVHPPQSYQPWAVTDALIALGLSRVGELEVVAADINPRVVEHLRGARREPPTLHLVSEIRESDTVKLSEEFREYFGGLGQGVGETGPGAAPGQQGDLRKSIRIRPDAAATLHAETLDIVTERLAGTAFDLVIATNILPYFDDAELMLAMSNVAAMLVPGGAILHNETRPVMQDLTAALGMPLEQSRHAIIATVRGAPAPLFDSVFLHVRR